MDAVEDYVDICGQIIVDIEVVESSLRSEEAATSSSSSTHQKSRTTSWQAEDDGWKVREETVHGRRTGKSSGMTLRIKKLRRALAAHCRRHLPQQSSSSAREEEDHWVLMEDRRWRSTAFENLAKEMLRYLDNSDDVKVGTSELQERLEVPVQIGIPFSRPSRREVKMAKRFSKYFGKKKKRSMLLAGPDGMRSGKAKSSWKEDVKTQVWKYKC